MKIAGRHTLPFPRERAYDLLQDPALLAQCMPGCEALERTGEDEYAMKMKMMLASMNSLFAGTVRITDSRRPETFRLIVEGTGKVGFMKGDGLLELGETEAGTEVSYEGDVQIGGTLASVGQRLIDSTARLLIRRFFEKLIKVSTEAQEAAGA